MPEVLSETSEAAVEVTLSEQVDRTDDAPEPGALARVLAVPLAPVVVGWDATKAFFTRLVPHLSRRLAGALRSWAQAAGSLLRRTVRPLTEALRSVGRALRRLIEGVGPVVRRVVQSLGAVIGQACRFARRFATLVAGRAAHLAALAWRPIAGVARRVGVVLRSAVRSVLGALRHTATSVAAVWRRVAVAVRAATRTALVALRGVWRRLASVVRGAVRGTWVAVRGALRRVLIPLRQLGRALAGIARRLAIGVRAAVASTLAAFRGVTRRVASAVRGVIGSAIVMLRAAVRRVAVPLRALARSFATTVTRTFGAFRSALARGRRSRVPRNPCGTRGARASGLDGAQDRVEGIRCDRGGIRTHCGRDSFVRDGSSDRRRSGALADPPVRVRNNLRCLVCHPSGRNASPSPRRSSSQFGVDDCACDRRAGRQRLASCSICRGRRAATHRRRGAVRARCDTTGQTQPRRCTSERTPPPHDHEGCGSGAVSGRSATGTGHSGRSPSPGRAGSAIASAPQALILLNRVGAPPGGRGVSSSDRRHEQVSRVSGSDELQELGDVIPVSRAQRVDVAASQPAHQPNRQIAWWPQPIVNRSTNHAGSAVRVRVSDLLARTPKRGRRRRTRGRDGAVPLGRSVRAPRCRGRIPGWPGSACG